MSKNGQKMLWSGGGIFVAGILLIMLLTIVKTKNTIRQLCNDNDFLEQFINNPTYKNAKHAQKIQETYDSSVLEQMWI